LAFVATRVVFGRRGRVEERRRRTKEPDATAVRAGIRASHHARVSEAFDRAIARYSRLVMRLTAAAPHERQESHPQRAHAPECISAIAETLRCYLSLLNDGSAAFAADDVLCLCQHEAQRHSIMKVPSRDVRRVTRQPYDELMRVCDVFVGGAMAAHPKHF
jgi:hypothetical protein